MKRRIVFIVLLLLVAGAATYFLALRRPRQLVLTGIVTTDSVIVSAEIQGRLKQLLVAQGDWVTNGQLLARIQPQEWKADVSFYSNSEQQYAAQVTQAEADLRYQEAQTSNQVRQAEATLASTQSQARQAEADLEIAQLNFQREEDLRKQGVNSTQAYDQARTTYDSAKARAQSLREQAQAAEAAVGLAKSNEEQIAARRAVVQANLHQLAAAGAQKEKAQVHLEYTEIRAPINGIVDIRAALPGEVVTAGQGIVTLVDPENLWVRIDVEETYIDGVRLGDKLMVRLPSGAMRQGTVFFRGIDADYATQRDVSRTKRDIKTFEIRLRCDNRDRSLALGMTAYVTLPLTRP
ncbi:MAG TPA: HlyD family efflux transporter periplasmic adaptor subunit [Candidatus Limnocylindrales bacterium]|nr:HlyD family efflux transporter periplasmic adaptor subunit [Candidatus Limnocylindrales bacterium]